MRMRRLTLLLFMSLASAAHAGTTLPSTLLPIVPPMLLMSQSSIQDFGAVIDVRRVGTQGAVVLAVTPGGDAERMGLRAGDRILSVNGRTLSDISAPDAALQSAIGAMDGRLRMDVLRNGTTLSLHGNASAVSRPAPTPVPTGCGYVTTLGTVPVVSRNIHPAGITMIDGRFTAIHSANRYRLDAGTHVLVLAENIGRNRLSDTQQRQIDLMLVRRRNRDNFKALIVDIKPNVAYYVGARLLPDRLDADSIHANAYWEPVIWQERPMTCR